MIGARGHNDQGDELIVLGLTTENVRRLQDGKPMLLRSETHPFVPAGWVITILVGPDEDTLARWLRQPGTDVRRWEEPDGDV